MINPSPLSSRLQLAQLCNNRGLLGTAVEIGTHRGRFAADFLRSWQGQHFYGVDPYHAGVDKDGQDFGTAKQREEDHLEATRGIREAARGRRWDILVKSSLEAVNLFLPGAVDFVYLDGSHAYDDVLADIKAWWPTLKPGGILAGHDVVCFGEKNNAKNWGINVQAAIVTWLQRLIMRPDVWIILEQEDLRPLGACWSWYVFKEDENKR